MNVSCLPVSLFPEISKGLISLGEWAKIGRNAGLDAIDLSVLLIRNYTPAYIKKIKQEFDSVGIPVTMIAAYSDFTHPDPLHREREFQYLLEVLALASSLSAKYVRITAGQAHSQTPKEKGKKWVIEYFKKASSFADKYELMLLFENHSKPSVWEFSDFSHPTDIFLEIFEQIRDTGIRINFDTANTLVYGDDPLAVLEQVKSYVETIHAADILAKGRLEPVLLGEGIVPFEKIFNNLKKDGFDGWICIEEASQQGKEGIFKAAKVVRQKWEEAGQVCGQ